jgi:hypothetical protein
MMEKGLLFISLFVYLFSSLQAEEPFRIFKTASGQTLEAKAVGYDGQIFILVDKSGRMFGPKFNDFSVEDRTYLVEAVKAKRIPKGRPSPPSSGGGSASTTAKGVDFHSEIMPILQQRCNDCHKAPYEENGRTKKTKSRPSL